MICASCEEVIEDGGIICRWCNPAERPAGAATERVSHRDLAQTVRQLKTLVLLSVMFGFIAAPFAIYIASKALHRYRETDSNDAAVERQLVVLRRVAIGLLVVWAFFLGTQLAALLAS